MPRGPDHRKDDELDRSLYREFDVEDLVRIVGWVREIDRQTFTAGQVRAISVVTTGGKPWGFPRIRRVLRVGVEIGWLRVDRKRYEVTREAPATLPPFAPMCNAVAQECETTPDRVRLMNRDALARAFEGRWP